MAEQWQDKLVAAVEAGGVGGGGDGLTDDELRASPLPLVPVAPINIGNFPAVQPVSGTVAVSNFPAVAGTVAVSNFPATQSVSGSVAVNNFPATVSKTYKTAAFTLSATGTVVPAVAGKRIKVFAVKMSFTNTIGAGFRSGASTLLEGSVRGIKDSNLTESVTPTAFLFATAAGQSLDLVLSGNGVEGRVSYWDDDAT